MSWPMVPLSEVAPAKALKPPVISEDAKTWLLTLDNIESGTGKLLHREIQSYSSSGVSTHWFSSKHVLYSKLRPYLNKVLLPDQQGVGTTELVPMLPDEERLDRKYLAHYLRSSKFVSWVSNQTAGAKMPRVSMKVFWAHKIPLPPLQEQKSIVAILDKADAIRRKRQQAIELADEFLRSVFLDMFGDPVVNPHQFPRRTLKEFYIHEKTGTKCGPFGSALKKHEFQNTGVPVWNMDNITLAGNFIDNPSLWVSEPKFLELEAYSVKPGDIIISRAGTVGKMGVVHSRFEQSLISTNLIRVRFGNELLPEFFISLMTYCKGKLGRLKTGPDGAFTHMNTGILDSLEFPYPPVDLQQEYLGIRQSLQKKLLKDKAAAKDMETLFSSLSQKAFSGEL